MRGPGDVNDPALQYAIRTGRSWWALRYSDGLLIHEKERDWSHCPPKGRAMLRLYCPNGEMAEVGADSEQTGRLFQLKVAVRSAGVGIPASRQVLAHVIGHITGTDGQCELYAWEPGFAGPAQEPLAHALRRIAEHEGGFRAIAERARIDLPAITSVVMYRSIAEQARERREQPTGPALLALQLGGTLTAEQGARLVGAYGATYGFSAEQVRRWCGTPQLCGPLTDCAYHMAYHQLGALSPDHLGIAAA